MGGNVPGPKMYGILEGDPKPGESRVLRNAIQNIDPNEPATMLEILQ